MEQFTSLHTSTYLVQLDGMQFKLQNKLAEDCNNDTCSPNRQVVY